jgi:hypothetical protein
VKEARDKRRTVNAMRSSVGWKRGMMREGKVSRDKEGREEEERKAKNQSEK